VSRTPSKKSDTVECFRSEGPKNAKNNQDPAKNSKSKPSIAPSLPRGGPNEKKDEQDKARPRSSVAVVYAKNQEQDKKEQDFSIGLDGHGRDGLIEQLQLMCTKIIKMEEYIMELKKSLDEKKAMIKMDIVKEEKAIGLDLACDGVGPCQRNPQPACVDVGTQFDGDLVTVEVSVQTVDVVVAGVDCGVQVGSDVKLVSASVQTDVVAVAVADAGVQASVKAQANDTEEVHVVIGLAPSDRLPESTRDDELDPRFNDADIEAVSVSVNYSGKQVDGDLVSVTDIRTEQKRVNNVAPRVRMRP